MLQIPRPLIAATAVVVSAGGWWLLRPKPSELQSAPVVPEQALPRKAEAVAALGQLEPAGDIRSLAAPTAGIAGTPRIAALHVNEGALIQRGEVLATFDHRQGLLADLEEINAKLQSLQLQIALQTVEVSRFQKAAESGAAERVLVDNKREELIRMQGQRLEALAARKGLQTDLELSQLTSPIDGLYQDLAYLK